MDDVILETRGLTKEFLGFTAVKNVDLQVRRGTIHALIGPNGAGKTTVFNLLTKFLEPTAGSIYYKARTSPPSPGAYGAARHGALVPDLRRVPASDRAGERAHGAAAEARHFLSFLALGEQPRPPQRPRRTRCWGPWGWRTVSRSRGELPYGRKRALEIATTLALDPEMLLLDEPMAGMGHEDIGRIADLIRKVGGSRTVLMVEHNMSVVADLSDTITVLTRGADAGRGQLCSKSRRIPRWSKPTWGPAMPEAAVAQKTLLRVDGLHAWYGESHILHGMRFAVG